MKGNNNNALLSGRDSHTAKNYITTLILPLIPLFFSVLNGFLKTYVILRLSILKYGQNSKKK